MGLSRVNRRGRRSAKIHKRRRRHRGKNGRVVAIGNALAEDATPEPTLLLSRGSEEDRIAAARINVADDHYDHSEVVDAVVVNPKFLQDLKLVL